MSSYHETKKVRRIASVIFIMVMAFIVIGTTLSEQRKANNNVAGQPIPNP